MIDRNKIEEILENNPFSKLLHMECLDFGEGYMKGRIPLHPEFLNLYGGMHGGCIYALADTVAGIAAATYGYYVTTIDGKINYLKPVINTEYVICEARAIRQGGTIGYYQATISDDSGNSLAMAEFNYFRLKQVVEE